MKPSNLGFVVLLFTSCYGAALGPDKVGEIVQRSVQNTNADWNSAPKYDYTEHDVVVAHGKSVSKTYQVTMIDGSPYNKLISENGRPLAPGQAAAEDRKLAREIASRNSESPAVRDKRVAEYRRERRQDNALVSEMVKAFQFSFAGEDTVNGHRCYVLDATPKPGYQAPSRETEVLKGMRGRMWVDEQQYQWVKVHAEVFRPVSFGLFIARVQPGTAFTLEEAPVQGNLWLPSHFSMTLNARVWFSSRRSSDDETYSSYRPAASPAANPALNAGRLDLQ